MRTYVTRHIRRQHGVVAAIFIIVAIAFRSLTAPVVLVAAIQCAIWLNQSISYFTHTPLFFFSGLAINAIQLGATVDYAILMASTFRGKLGTCSPTHAMRLAVEESGPAILCSGGAMFAAIMGVYASTSLRAAKDLAALLARGAIVSTVVTTVLLPAVLLMAHKVLAKTLQAGLKGQGRGLDEGDQTAIGACLCAPHPDQCRKARNRVWSAARAEQAPRERFRRFAIMR